MPAALPPMVFASGSACGDRLHQFRGPHCVRWSFRYRAGGSSTSYDWKYFVVSLILRNAATCHGLSLLCGVVRESRSYGPLDQVRDCAWTCGISAFEGGTCVNTELVAKS